MCMASNIPRLVQTSVNRLICIDFIRSQCTIDDEDSTWTVYTTHTTYDGELQQEVTRKIHLTLEKVKEYSKRHTFTVTNVLDNYTVECTRDEVEDHVQKAIDAVIQDQAKKYAVIKRVKPVGDEVWGNWWRPVRVRSI